MFQSSTAQCGQKVCDGQKQVLHIHVSTPASKTDSYKQEGHRNSSSKYDTGTGKVYETYNPLFKKTVTVTTSYEGHRMNKKFIENNKLVLMPLCHVSGCLKQKPKQNGNVVRYKARFVITDHRQKIKNIKYILAISECPTVIL